MKSRRCARRTGRFLDFPHLGPRVPQNRLLERPTTVEERGLRCCDRRHCDAVGLLVDVVARCLAAASGDAQVAVAAAERRGVLHCCWPQGSARAGRHCVCGDGASDGSARLIRRRRVAAVAGVAARAVQQTEDGDARGGAGPRLDIRPNPGRLLRACTHPNDGRAHGRRRSARVRAGGAHQGVPGAAAAAHRCAWADQARGAAVGRSRAQGPRRAIREAVPQRRILDNRQAVCLPT